jgi:hypothetical protein
MQIEPDRLEYLPTSHSVQRVSAYCVVTKPRKHGMHASTPRALLKVPGGHATQAVRALFAKRPGSHATHRSTGVAATGMVPASQSEHTDIPVTLAKKPAGHGRHDCRSGEE